MLDRVLWLAAFISLATALGWLVRRGVGAAPPLAESAHNLIYFWGPHCAACAAAKQTLANVTRDAPWVRLRSINAIEHPNEARQWGVMTIPTIILLDDAGRVAFRASGSLSPGQLRDAIAAHQSRATIRE